MQEEKNEYAETEQDSFALMDALLSDLEQQLAYQESEEDAQPQQDMDLSALEEDAQPQQDMDLSALEEDAQPQQDMDLSVLEVDTEVVEDVEDVEAIEEIMPLPTDPYEGSTQDTAVQTVIDGMQEFAEIVLLNEETGKIKEMDAEEVTADEAQIVFTQIIEPDNIQDADAPEHGRRAEKGAQAKRRQREQTNRRRNAGKGDMLSRHTGYTAATLNLQQTLILFGVSLVLLVIGIFVNNPVVSIVLCVLAYLVLAIPQLVMCTRAFLRTKTISQGLCVLLASFITLCMQHGKEAVIAMMAYTTGAFAIDFLIGRVKLVTPQDAIKLPNYACKVDRSGVEERVTIQEVQAGSMYFVRDGEIVPADGIVLGCDGVLLRTVFEAEEKVMQIHKGDTALAGDVFSGEALLMKADKDYESCGAVKLESIRTQCRKRASIEDSVLANVNKYPGVALALALIIALIPPLFKIGTFGEWLHRGLTVFALGYPTALLLAVPIGFQAASVKFHDNGIWIKGNGVIENAANVRMVMFDKTGVLTNGQFHVKEVHTTDGFREADCIALAATAEQHSAHPVARSIVAAYGKQPPTIKEFEEIPGQGVVALVQGASLCVGNRSLMIAKGVKNVPDYQGTVLYIAYENNYIGAVVMEDMVREEVKPAMAELKKIGVLKTVLLTGDSELAAKKICENAGIESYHYGLVPEEKSAKVSFLLRTVPIDGTTAYVGDGIYDLQEQKIADVGIIMHPQDASRISDASDALIFSHDMKKLSKLLSISKRTHSVNVQNTLLTIALKLMLILIAVFGVIGMDIALFVDVVVSLLLILNTLKLSR